MPRRRPILHRPLAIVTLALVICWLALPPILCWSDTAPSALARLSGEATAPDATSAVDLDASATSPDTNTDIDAVEHPSPETADEPDEMAEAAGASIPAGNWSIMPEWLSGTSAALLTDLRDAPEAAYPASTPQVGFLRLELHGLSDNGELVPLSEAPSFKVDTSLSSKGSAGLSDGVWNRVRVTSSRVDLRTGERTTVFGDLVHQAQQLPYSSAWDTPDTKSPQALNVGFSRTSPWKAGQRWEYGVQYRSLDPRFEQFAGSDLKRDEAGTEAWVGWRSGPLRLRSFASQTWNNVAEDPNKDRTTQLLGGVGVEFELPSSTWLKLSYAQGTADRSRDFVTSSQRRRLGETPRTSSTSLEKMSASIYRWSEKWDVSLSSSYSPSQDADSPSQETLSTSQDLALSIRPTEKLGSTVMLSLWQERQEWTGYRSEGGTASLSLWYGPFLEGYTLSLWGSYDRGRSNDGYWDSQSVYASATLSRRLGQTVLGNAWLSLELGYNLYLDAIYSASSTDEVYGRVVLKLVEF